MEQNVFKSCACRKIEIIIAIEDEFGVSIPDEALEKVVTVQDACDLLKSVE